MGPAEVAAMDFILSASILLMFVFGIAGCALVVGEWIRDWARKRNRP